MFEASPPTRRFRPASAKEVFMRFAPVSACLSVALAITASSLQSAPAEVLDPRAMALVEQAQVALDAGNLDGAVDGFEAALAIQPGSNALVMKLAEVARRQGMQGKALHYYRVVLARSPQDLDAIAGEGQALAEKGAIEKARKNLSRLGGLCGSGCDQTRALDAAIAAVVARVPAGGAASGGAATPRIVTVDDVKPQAEVRADK
ncbi:hypothetical protein GTZ99_02000 [Novosphingobium sp. FSY-8]|uniref:Tetratricopeptide repeat protein n=2 Tax=Novosphingobium ovatum TaxID=1908523 RepID=A0ABW9X9Z6_9SPHN|nr:hypothetical protein [Novosphingobium ovatum]